MRAKSGFTLIELMVVVAILGILGAIAFPLYLNYIQTSKERALDANVDAAAALIRNELSKRNAGQLDALDAPADFVAALNEGRRKSVYDNSLSAFAVAGTGPGTVVISKDPVNRLYQVVAYDRGGNALIGCQLKIVLE